MSTRVILTIGSLLCSSVLLAQNITAVSNPAAVTQANTIAPGSLVSIFGGSLAGSLASAGSATLSTTLGDVTAVNINGIASPLVMVSDGQITAQVPWEVIPGPATVAVARGNSFSNAFSTQVNQFAPAFFNIRLGGLQAIAVNGDGSLAAPSGFLGALSAHPATAGDTLTLYATGLGPVTGGLADGTLPPDASFTTVNLPSVTIGGMAAQVSWSGMSPQFFGVYQLNVVVPQGVPTGPAVPIQMQVGGASTSDPVTIALQ
jgi:uncharacterized protein (TIGR03437 family)